MSLADPRALADFSDLLPVGAIKFRPQVYQQVDGQASGSLLVQELASPLWLADIALDFLLYPEARRLQAIINSLQPPATFLLCDPVSAYPASDPTGALLADSAVSIGAIGDDGASMTFAGLPVGFELTTGDRFDLDFGADPVRHALLELAEGGVASADGSTVALAVNNVIWPGITADTPVNFIRPAARMMFVPSQDLGLNYRNTKTDGLTFQAIERL